jgi:hypothetical protein
MTTSHLKTGVEPTPETSRITKYTLDNVQCPPYCSYNESAIVKRNAKREPLKADTKGSVFLLCKSNVLLILHVA